MIVDKIWKLTHTVRVGLAPRSSHTQRQGGKSVSEKSKSSGAKCLSENSTGGKSGVTRNSANPFKTYLLTH